MTASTDGLLAASAALGIAAGLLRKTPGALDDPLIHAVHAGIIREKGNLDRAVIKRDWQKRHAHLTTVPDAPDT